MRTLRALTIATLINALSASASADLIPPDQDEHSNSPPASDYYDRYPELLEREPPAKPASSCARGGGSAGFISIAIGLTLLALTRRRAGDDDARDALAAS